MNILYCVFVFWICVNTQKVRMEFQKLDSDYEHVKDEWNYSNDFYTTYFVEGGVAWVKKDVFIQTFIRKVMLNGCYKLRAKLLNPTVGMERCKTVDLYLHSSYMSQNQLYHYSEVNKFLQQLTLSYWMGISMFFDEGLNGWVINTEETTFNAVDSVQLYRDNVRLLWDKAESKEFEIKDRSRVKNSKYGVEHSKIVFMMQKTVEEEGIYYADFNVKLQASYYNPEICAEMYGSVEFPISEYTLVFVQKPNTELRIEDPNKNSVSSKDIYSIDDAINPMFVEASSKMQKIK